jgi:hypothetical protein
LTVSMLRRARSSLSNPLFYNAGMPKPLFYTKPT